MDELRTLLIDRLAQLGVEHRPLQSRDDGFASLCHRGKAFAHFHSDCELDIRLTKATIVREGLIHPPDSTVHPNRAKGSHWIELRFYTRADVDRIVRLVRLLLKGALFAGVV